jgi:hypothetical protein
MTEKHCYTFTTHQYTDGLWDVSATYIIHLKNNGREKDIETQLSQLHPSNIVHICNNAGYKKCNKPDLIAQIPPADLIHAFMTVFKDAKSRGYGAILVLEDDFQFDMNELQSANKNTHCTNINRFIHTNTATSYVLKLGGMPFVLLPRTTNTYYGITCGMHCCIYSKPYQEKLLVNSHLDIGQDWDVYNNLFTSAEIHVYYKSLCNQYFTSTDNSKHWGGENPIYRIFGFFIILFMKCCKLDTSFAAYPYLYVFAKLWVFIILFIMLLYYGIRYTPIKKAARLRK